MVPGVTGGGGVKTIPGQHPGLHLLSAHGEEVELGSVNSKLAALLCFNSFLLDIGVQEDLVLGKRDYLKVQQQFANLSVKVGIPRGRIFPFFFGM